MKVGAFFFAPYIIPTLVTLILVPLFIWLGLWQLERAEYKGVLSEQMEQQKHKPPLDLNDLVDSNVDLEYREVKVRGYFEPNNQVFIENRKHNNKNGFHVVTPLRIEEENTRVLINRGWVPMNAEQSRLPAVETPVGIVEVTGKIDIPKPPAIKLSDEKSNSDSGNRWPYLTVERFAQMVDYPIKHFVVLQSPNGDQGFVRQWPVRKPNKLMHIGYALQWFAFAIITSLIYLRLSISTEPTTHKEKSQ